jgi:uncharacterized protein YjbI with pentapeptide repeats
MANLKDLQRALKGRAAWNKWARECRRKGLEPHVDFSNTTINVGSFEGFVFPGRANFSGTIFSHDVTFRDARFRGKARFTGARFRGTVRFSAAKFRVIVCLDRAIFSKDAIFAEAQFKSAAYLVHNRFKDYANFSHSEFDGPLRLTHSTFDGETVFDGARFNRPARPRRNSRGQNNAVFTGINVKHHLVRFRMARFGSVPDFRASKFAVPPNLEGMTVQYVCDADARTPLWQRWAGRAQGEEDAPKFRRLKELAHESKNHERELKFFADELKSKRFYETKGPAIWMNVAFECLSDFGKGVERPVFWLILLLFSGAAAVLFEYPPPKSTAAYAHLGFVIASFVCRFCGKAYLLSYLIIFAGGLSILAWSPVALMAAMANSFSLLGGTDWSSDCRVLKALKDECEFMLFRFC